MLLNASGFGYGVVHESINAVGSGRSCDGELLSLGSLSETGDRPGLILSSPIRTCAFGRPAGNPALSQCSPAQEPAALFQSMPLPFNSGKGGVMPRKLKVGDRAKVVRVPHYAPDDIKVVVGSLVEVVAINPADGFTPYVVRVIRGQGQRWRASAWNLEAAPAKARSI